MNQIDQLNFNEQEQKVEILNSQTEFVLLIIEKWKQ